MGTTPKFSCHKKSNFTGFLNLSKLNLKWVFLLENKEVKKFLLR